MASQKLSAAGLAIARLATRRMMSTGAKVESVSQTQQAIDLANFDPNNYNIPLRTATLDDTMEPYGSWKEAYEKERRLANKTLLKGICSFTFACLVVIFGGVFEGVILPNLDNIMEETEPWDFEEKHEEGRITV